MSEFKPFPKMARLSRECIITEKIDGTNAQICILPAYTPEGANDAAGSLGTFDDHIIWAGSRTRWIQPGKQTDNYGFAGWVRDNFMDLLKLGPGQHFGEWWGCGIQRNYEITERRFSLFNASRWTPAPLGGGVFDHQVIAPGLDNFPRRGPDCVHVVPTLYRGEFRSDAVEECLRVLKEHGSRARPGFANPEGIIVYHVAAGIGFKKTLDGDEAKGAAK